MFDIGPLCSLNPGFQLYLFLVQFYLFVLHFASLVPGPLDAKTEIAKGMAHALSAGKEKTIFIKAKEDMQMIRPN